MSHTIIENDACQLAQAALAKSPIYALRDCQVEQEGDHLLISGHVGSFYHKQLAQEAVLAVVSRRCHVVNTIAVTRP